ncbi:hypothetical protein ACO0QE_000846 [Hanseniaspora vineae]
MKFLTTNFLKCSVKSCDISNDSFPLQYNGETCKIEQTPIDTVTTTNPADGSDIEEEYINYEFLLGIIDRLDWNAVLEVAHDLGNTSLPASKPSLTTDGDFNETDADYQTMINNNKALLRDLQILLMQTNIVEGDMKCKNCGHVYYIKNGIPNLLLPPHLA